MSNVCHTLCVHRTQCLNVTLTESGMMRCVILCTIVPHSDLHTLLFVLTRLMILHVVLLLELATYSGTSDEGPSEIGITSLQRTLVSTPDDKYEIELA